MRSFQTSDCNQVKMQFLLFVRMETQNYKCIYSSFKKKKENKKEKTQLTVGLEPTTSGLEVQCAIQLRHASSWKLLSDVIEKGEVVLVFE